MPWEFEVDVAPRDLFRLVTRSVDSRVVLRVNVAHRFPTDVAFKDEKVDAGPAYDFRAPGVPTRMRVRCEWKVLGGIRLNILASPLGASSWHLEMFIKRHLAAIGRVDLLNTDEPVVAMARSPRLLSERRVVLHLSNNNYQGRLEGVVVSPEGWTSAGGGWLDPQSGRWVSSAEGLHLRAGESGTDCAFCEGLNIGSATVGESGNSHYVTIGDAGNWTVADVVEMKPDDE